MRRVFLLVSAISFLALTACKNKETDAAVNENDAAKIETSVDKNVQDASENNQNQAEATTGIKDINEFVPAGYSILKKATADLNNDGTQDVVMILKPKGEEKMQAGDKRGKRLLVILVKDQNNFYTEAAKSDEVALCYNCGGQMEDPLQELKASKGEFSITHYGGATSRWERKITFEYDIKKTWSLSDDRSEFFSAMDPTNVDYVVKGYADFGYVPLKDFVYEKEY